MGLTPFHCVLGYQPPLFPWSGEPSDVPAVEEWYRQSQGGLGARPRSTAKGCEEAEDSAGPTSSTAFPSYQVGQKVNPVAYRLRLPASYRICPTFHVSLLKPAHPVVGEARTGEEPLPPLDIKGASAYQVQTLLNSRRVRSRLQYLVDWEGYSPEERNSQWKTFLIWHIGEEWIILILLGVITGIFSWAMDYGIDFGLH
ncbi:hypothetical protein QTP70_007799 [Hemibagrus guttatus]|uniref:Chromo domain-containing protein n=1 Tax=Hemibagrus guttatus TaxID=175788 RepID=A0AAE0QS73_9TELE|nr:hypothetical protein QTP70_007799 [Hemibagrus guttatus]